MLCVLHAIGAGRTLRGVEAELHGHFDARMQQMEERLIVTVAVIIDARVQQVQLDLLNHIDTRVQQMLSVAVGCYWNTEEKNKPRVT